MPEANPARPLVVQRAGEQDGDRPSGTGPVVQTATAEVRLGEHVSLRAEVRVTPAGLLAIGALVSGIILSVAPLVWSARRRRY